MALGDITIYDQAAFGYPGSNLQNVAASATVIFPGEPVAKALGAAVVTPAATNTPVVGTDFFAGVAADPKQSTNTSTAAGSLHVTKMDPNITYLIAPKVAATWNTQAKYDALVGARVLLDLTAGVYTLLAADGATNGCVVEAMDITENPEKVRFSFRQAVSYKA